MSCRQPSARPTAEPEIHLCLRTPTTLNSICEHVECDGLAATLMQPYRSCLCIFKSRQCDYVTSLRYIKSGLTAQLKYEWNMEQGYQTGLKPSSPVA